MACHSLVSYPEKSLSNSWVFYVDKGADSLMWGVLAKAYNICTLKKEARESGVQNHKNQELGMWTSGSAAASNAQGHRKAPHKGEKHEEDRSAHCHPTLVHSTTAFLSSGFEAPPTHVPQAL